MHWFWSQGDDGLNPIAKLEKFAASENIFNRQMVARTVLETLRQVGTPEENYSILMELFRWRLGK